MRMSLISIDPSRIFSVGDILTYILVGPFGPVIPITLSLPGLGARILLLTGVSSLPAISISEPIFFRIFVIDRLSFPSFSLSLGL